jgi:secreted Zn-dependent insulinase-like peptidase
MDNKQSMVHVRLYREGGRYVESVKKKSIYIYIYIIANEQPSGLGYQISNKSWVTRVHRGDYKEFY